jgi:hypothetical protein
MTKRLILPLALLLCAFGCPAGEIEIELEVRVTVPDTTWTVAIEEVYEVGDELWVISAVSQNTEIMGAQVISTVRDSLKLTAPDLPVQYYVTGKTWGWENEEPYTFIESLQSIEQELKSGRLVYRKSE